MTVKELFELMESPLYLTNVDLCFGSDCENAAEMTADKVIAKYGDKQISSFDVSAISITI